MDKYDPYIARPRDVYVVCLPLLMGGAVAMVWDGASWFWLGLVVFLTGVACVGWIVYVGVLQAQNEWRDNRLYYFGQMVRNAQLLDRVKDPNVWAAMGYELPIPEQARIEHAPEDKAPNTLPRLAYPTPPATTPQMQVLANDVLRGGALSENRWAGPDRTFSGPAWRKLMKWGEHSDRRYWVFINPKIPKKGRALTRRGTEFMLFYADEELKKLFRLEGHPGFAQVSRGGGEETSAPQIS